MHDLSHFFQEPSFDFQASMSRLAQIMGLQSVTGGQGWPRADRVAQIARALYFVATEPELPEPVRQLLVQMCRRWRQEAACTWDEVYAAWPEPQPYTYERHGLH